MIITEIYKGQGLGNQLWCYVTTRVIAKDKGYDFGIKSPEKFKCNDFLSLDFGKQVVGGDGPEGGPPKTLPDGIKYYYNERKITHPIYECDIRMHDKDLVNILDCTKIDGIMQDEQYIIHRKDEIKEWLKVKEDHEFYDFSSDDICIINFRGGEYSVVKDFFLPKEYWTNAINNMLKINEHFKFIVITDDVVRAKEFFPNFDVFHFSISKDYAIIKNAHYLILSNSTFAWFPAWLSENLKFCIAPKYWGRYNISDGFWSCGYNITKGWLYQSKDGRLQCYDECVDELNEYIKKHKGYFAPVKIKDNFLVVSNYNNDIRWVPDYTDNYIIYDQSEVPEYPKNIDLKKVVKNKHTGHNLSDYFTFIIDNYDNLPDCTIFFKGNGFPRHVPREYFDRIANNDYFTPIEDPKMHKTYWPTCFFSSDGGFCEINNSWYLGVGHPLKYFYNYNDFLRFCFKDPVIPKYVRFAPGGMYIVPKQNILKLPKIFYENLKTFVSYAHFPSEAYIVERALYTLWTCSFELSKNMLTPLSKDFVAVRPQKREDEYRLIKKYIPAFIKRNASPLIKVIAKNIYRLFRHSKTNI